MCLPSSVQITYVWGHFAIEQVSLYAINYIQSLSRLSHKPKLYELLLAKTKPKVLLPLPSSLRLEFTPRADPLLRLHLCRSSMVAHVFNCANTKPNTVT